jgi:hypothetical protein
MGVRIAIFMSVRNILVKLTIEELTMANNGDLGSQRGLTTAHAKA